MAFYARVSHVVSIVTYTYLINLAYENRRLIDTWYEVLGLGVMWVLMAALLFAGLNYIVMGKFHPWARI